MMFLPKEENKNKQRDKVHRRQVHNNKDAKCEICHKVNLKNEINLKMHTRRVHDHEKAECDICHTVFKNKHPCNVHRTMVKMSGLMSDLPFLQDFEE